MSDKIINQYKLLFLGDTTVGKTCCCLRITQNVYTGSHLSTIGTDSAKKNIEVVDRETNKKVQIQMMLTDTAGQERFRAMAKSYYRQADGIFLMYDITLKETFLNIENWINQIKECASPDVVIYLLANKIDMKDKIQVTSEEGKQCAEKFKLKYREISCKENINVNEVFNEISSELYEKNKNMDKSTKVNITMNKGKRKCCG